MNAILHRLENLLEAEYFQRRALDAVALLIIHGAAYFGRRRWARGILQVFLGLNAPVVLLLIIAIAREARAAQALQGAERGMAVGMLVGSSLPVFLEFLLPLAAWPRLRAQPQGQMQKS